MVVVVGIGGGVDQVQILVDVGFGDGGAVHGREVLEPRGRGPVAASIGAGGAAPRCVAARHEGAGLARGEGSATSCARRQTGCPSCRRGAPSCLPTPRERPKRLQTMRTQRQRHAFLEVLGPRPRRVARRHLAPAGSCPGPSRPRLFWCWWRHLDEMLTFGVCHNMTSAIDVGSFPLKLPPTPRRQTPASVVARLSARPRRYRLWGFIRARTRPRSDARPPRGTRSSSGWVGHRIPIRRVGLVLGTRHYGSFYGNGFTGGAFSEPEPPRPSRRRGPYGPPRSRGRRKRLRSRKVTAVLRAHARSCAGRPRAPRAWRRLGGSFLSQTTRGRRRRRRRRRRPTRGSG